MSDLSRLFAVLPVHVTREMAARVGWYGDNARLLDISERDGILYFQGDEGAASRLFEENTNFVTADGALFSFAPGAPAPSVRVDEILLTRVDRGAELVTSFQRLLEQTGDPTIVADVSRPDWVRDDVEDLVEISSVDPRILIDLKYASADNFMGRPIYPDATAALRRPVAEALSRAENMLRNIGFGLVVYDAYRPWAVTKLFWDLVPSDARAFVADPAVGSKHNRGCAVDVTMYDLSTGCVVEMTGRFDEPTVRSAADYAGGTSVQRWHRDLLRTAMEAQGFAVQQNEWWHFDHVSWSGCAALDVGFDCIRGSTDRASHPDDYTQ